MDSDSRKRVMRSLELAEGRFKRDKYNVEPLLRSKADTRMDAQVTTERSISSVDLPNNSGINEQVGIHSAGVPRSTQVPTNLPVVPQSSSPSVDNSQMEESLPCETKPSPSALGGDPRAIYPDVAAPESLPGIESRAAAHGGASVTQYLEIVTCAGNDLGQTQPPANAVGAGPVGVEISPSEPTTTSKATDINIAVPTEEAISQSQALKYMDVDIPPNSAESSISGWIEQPVPQQTQEPSKEASTKKDLKRAVPGLTDQSVDALKFGPLQDVSDLLQGAADMYITEKAINKEYEALRQRLQALHKFLERFNVGILPEVASKINGIHEYVGRELSSLRNTQSGERDRFLEYNFLACCRRIQDYMDGLALDTSPLVWNIEEEQSKHRLSTSLRIGRIEEENSRDGMFSWVSRLPSSPSAWYDASAGVELKRRGCTPGTRTDVLANLLAWAGGNNADAVYWLNGMAGTGKTTIAYSICKELASTGQLAASFFCSRLRQECRDVNLIIPSIAYQLARFSPQFQSALSAVIEKDRGAHHKVLDQQFEALIMKPLLAVLAAGSLVTRRMVVVIDALDECDNRDSTRTILKLLLNKAVDLPIKFIVSSRPEPQIREEMTNERVRSRLVLHELDTGNVRTDIKTYLQDELKSMKPPPEEAQIAALVDRAGILFIYAATAVRYIGYGNFRNAAARLRTLLDGSPTKKTRKYEEIDQLYMIILDAALGDHALEEDEKDDMQQVLHTVICAREPLTVRDLSELLQIKNVERVRAAIQPLWSVLHVIGANELVTTLHASFPDFMFVLTRSKTYHCDWATHQLKLAESCIERINLTWPQFNICGLESSYLPDHSVHGIEERVVHAISSDLLYACRYWAEHLVAAIPAPKLAAQLEVLLATKLLLWLEVLNLTHHIEAAPATVKQAEAWCIKNDCSPELVRLSHDAWRFTATFAMNP
ncbi:unnamed protein product, partial [Rhizoctonia solani]